jgi:hypothetical protein
MLCFQFVQTKYVIKIFTYIHQLEFLNDAQVFSCEFCFSFSHKDMLLSHFVCSIMGGITLLIFQVPRQGN